MQISRRNSNLIDKRSIFLFHKLDCKVNGVPLVDAVAKDLNELAEKLGVEKLNEN